MKQPVFDVCRLEPAAAARHSPHTHQSAQPTTTRERVRFTARRRTAGPYLRNSRVPDRRLPAAAALKDRTHCPTSGGITHERLGREASGWSHVFGPTTNASTKVIRAALTITVVIGVPQSLSHSVPPERIFYNSCKL